MSQTSAEREAVVGSRCCCCGVDKGSLFMDACSRCKRRSCTHCLHFSGVAEELFVCQCCESVEQATLPACGLCDGKRELSSDVCRCCKKNICCRCVKVMDIRGTFMQCKPCNKDHPYNNPCKPAPPDGSVVGKQEHSKSCLLCGSSDWLHQCSSCKKETCTLRDMRRNNWICIECCVAAEDSAPTPLLPIKEGKQLQSLPQPSSTMSSYQRWRHSSLFRNVSALLLMLLCPSLLLLLWFCVNQLGGSLAQLLQFELLPLLARLWAENGLGSTLAWSVVLGYCSLLLLLMRVLPGRVVTGSMTAAGYAPQYRDNGLACFLVVLLLYGLGVYYLQLLQPSLVYHHFGELLGALNVLSLLLCAALYWKAGRKESAGGQPLFDFYWGLELHPRLLDWDVKQFTNCRLGMSSWCLLNLCFAHTQWEQRGYVADSMLLCVGLQALYLLKFHWWEAGYLRSLDMMHDRAGFYICWGCMVWVPGFYTLAAHYLVQHPLELGWPLSGVLLFAGVFFIWLNYDVDRQRQQVRSSGGQCSIWGKPARCIEAFYKDEAGVVHSSLLLTSGWWGVSRHFHYIPEVAAALCWSLPAGFSHATPYLYVLFLVVLLVERAQRDDVRCSQKYGSSWEAYCSAVPYRIVPLLW